MFFKRKTNFVNSQVVQVKTDRITKRVVRDAKKRVKRGELPDSHALSLYLKYIDSRYEHLRAQVLNTTTITDYEAIRAAKIAETRQLMAFYDTEFGNLRKLYSNLQERAKESGRTNDLKQDIATPPDMSELKKSLEKLTSDSSKQQSATTKKIGVLV